MLLTHVSGWLVLLCPLSWGTWQLQLARPDNWWETAILVATALLLYGALKIRSYRRAGRAALLMDEMSIA